MALEIIENCLIFPNRSERFQEQERITLIGSAPSTWRIWPMPSNQCPERLKLVPMILGGDVPDSIDFPF